MLANNYNTIHRFNEPKIKNKESSFNSHLHCFSVFSSKIILLSMNFELRSISLERPRKFRWPYQLSNKKKMILSEFTLLPEDFEFILQYFWWLWKAIVYKRYVIIVLLHVNLPKPSSLLRILNKIVRSYEKNGRFKSSKKSNGYEGIQQQSKKEDKIKMVGRSKWRSEETATEKL